MCCVDNSKNDSFFSCFPNGDRGDTRHPTLLPSVFHKADKACFFECAQRNLFKIANQ